jgi:hypothetical protein
MEAVAKPPPVISLYLLDIKDPGQHCDTKDHDSQKTQINPP